MTGPGTRRRTFLRGVAAAGATTASAACRVEGDMFRTSRPDERSGAERLSFRPDDTTGRSDRSGTVELPGVAGHPPAYAYVPPGVAAPLALVVMLHGAGGRADRSLDLMSPLADRHGFAVLAPKSSGPTWDRIRGGAFGPDVRNLDAVLERFGGRWAVSALVLAGFSDGASYALSLGMSNGDLLDGILAFSPGFAAPARVRGKPPVFVSHGVDDAVLPIDRCSRRIVPALEDEGYDVTYREFEGGHEMPRAVREGAALWLTEGR